MISYSGGLMSVIPLQESPLELILPYLPLMGLILSGILLIYLLTIPMSRIRKHYFTLMMIVESILIMSVLGLIVYCCLGVLKGEPLFAEALSWIGNVILIISFVVASYTIHQYGLKANSPVLLSIAGLALVSFGLLDYYYRYYYIGSDLLSVLMSYLLGTVYGVMLSAVLAISFILTMIPVHTLLLEYKRSKEVFDRVKKIRSDADKIKRSIDDELKELREIQKKFEEKSEELAKLESESEKSREVI